MDATLAVDTEEFRSIMLWHELSFGTISYGHARVWLESRFNWSWMLEFEEKIVNVSRHADTTAAARIIPLDGDASKFVAGHVELDAMVFLEEIQEEIKVLDANVFDTKVIDNEAELDW